MSESKELTKGIFISFEGIEGSGKTTQAKLLAERLSETGYEVVLTQEPGGTIIGDKIREILLQSEHKEMSYIAELLLYNAARAQHLTERILPAINNGNIVITDRFTDSTVAYQGYGRGIDISLIVSIDTIAANSIKPDLTILFDLDAEVGIRRNKDINKVDRFELEDVEFHRKVRNGYLKIAEMNTARVKIVDASMPIEQVREKVWENFLWLLKT